VVQKQKDRLDAIGQRRDKLRAQLLALAE
jgi:hypothetical protein